MENTENTEGALENTEENTENAGEVSQAIEAYACTCGFTTPDKKTFNQHNLAYSRDPDHRSRGRINTETGEVTMPPAKDRTLEQRREAKYGRKKEPVGTKLTETLSSAMQIKFVPRAYTIDYSPILRAAQDAAINFWGWRPDMPLGNFIDTVCYLFFKEKGITLAGYIIEETEEEKEMREQAIKKYREEVPV